MWEEIVRDETGKLIEKVVLRATALKCSREVAYYIIKLEERLDRIESDIDARHGRMIESIDRAIANTDLQGHLE